MSDGEYYVYDGGIIELTDPYGFGASATGAAPWLTPSQVSAVVAETAGESSRPRLLTSEEIEEMVVSAEKAETTAGGAGDGGALRAMRKRAAKMTGLSHFFGQKASAKPEPTADTHVTIVPYFTVPEGKMDEFKRGFAAFYEGAKAGTDECLYYGFCVCGDKVFCREGYKSAAGVLAHLGDVKAPLDAAVALVGEGGLDLSVMGPAAELEKLKEALGPLGTKFWATDGANIMYPHRFSSGTLSASPRFLVIAPRIPCPQATTCT